MFVKPLLVTITLSLKTMLTTCRKARFPGPLTATSYWPGRLHGPTVTGVTIHAVLRVIQHSQGPEGAGQPGSTLLLSRKQYRSDPEVANKFADACPPL
eukprot:g9562.t1